MENIELQDSDLKNFDLSMASGFREPDEAMIPAWLVNPERRMAFDYEACAAADQQWLKAVITERVEPGVLRFIWDRNPRWIVRSVKLY